MPNRLIAIGDIHGCHKALDALLDYVDPGKDDRVVTLGDYTDRGTGSKAVIDRLIKLSRQTDLIPILGNHDEMFMKAAEGDRKQEWNWLQNGGQRTLESYGVERAGDAPKAHLDFLKSCVDYHETADAILVHGSLDPDLDPEFQNWQRWRWMHLRPGNPCEVRGHMSEKHIYCGHTAQTSGEPLRLPWLTCIDTACCFGGWLTAVDILSGDYWQTDRFGKVREAHA